MSQQGMDFSYLYNQPLPVMPGTNPLPPVGYMSADQINTSMGLDTARAPVYNSPVAFGDYSYGTVGGYPSFGEAAAPGTYSPGSGKSSFSGTSMSGGPTYGPGTGLSSFSGTPLHTPTVFDYGTSAFNPYGGQNNNQVFDPFSYYKQNPDVWSSGADAWAHYNTTGQSEGRQGTWADSFDTQNYLANNPDVFASGVDPTQHWFQFGSREGRTGGGGENPFDKQNYLANNPDVWKAGADPIQHWLTSGQSEGRQGGFGGPDFNEQNYLANNPDVFRSGADPIQHYLQFGMGEGRQGAWGENPFNKENYLANNPDVFRAGADPFQHWLQSGSQEGRTGAFGENPFNKENYLANNPDVFKAGMDPTAHWMQFGSQEGRTGGLGGPDFNEQNYFANNPDVWRAGADPIQHYLQFGMGEGRQGGWGENPFDTQNYLNHNTDVAAAGMDPTAHWMQFGSQEGRQGAWGDDPFNAQEYLLQNRDVAASGMDPTAHWRQFGSQEGREAAWGGTEESDWTGYLDRGYGSGRDAVAAAYLQSNPDVLEAAKASGQDPSQYAFDHLTNFGQGEGRDFFGYHFDPESYLAYNQDVFNAGADPLQHYLKYGITEGREGAFGDPDAYLMMAAGGDYPYGQPTGIGDSGYGDGYGGYGKEWESPFPTPPGANIADPTSFWASPEQPNEWAAGRAKYGTELANDPARMYEMAVRLYLELRGDPVGRQGIAEAMLNRNTARGQDPLDPKYFPHDVIKDPRARKYLADYAHWTREMKNNPQLLGRIYGEIGRAVNGSNITKGATDWGSLGVADTAAKYSTETWKSPGEGERFFRKDIINNWAGPTYALEIQNWYNAMKGLAPQWPQ